MIEKWPSLDGSGSGLSDGIRLKLKVWHVWNGMSCRYTREWTVMLTSAGDSLFLEKCLFDLEGYNSYPGNKTRL